jgi:hypothetical protein
MGTKPNFPLLNSRPADLPRRTALKAIVTGAFALALTSLTSCISDGPNRTGGDYLAQHGILLQDSLSHVVLKGFPVDSFWTTDSDPSHLGDTVLLAGRQGDFVGEASIGFQIADTSMLDSLVPGDSTTLRLSLAFPKPTIALAELKATLENPSVRDTLKFVVTAWDFTNKNTPDDDDWDDTVSRINRQFLIRQDTVGALPPPAVKDTIFLLTKTAYAGDTTGIQARALPNLFKQVLSAPSNRHLVQLRITHLPGPNSDSGAAMVRLGGQRGDQGSLIYGPLLVFGKTTTAITGTKANRLQALYIGSTRGLNYTLQYHGPRANMLTAKQRGLHVILDRARLLASIDTALIRAGKTPPTRSADAEFDLTYFVPFAKMTLPLDSPSLEGGFPLEMRIITAVDSLLEDTVMGGIRIDEIPTGQSKVLWNTTEPGHPETILDEVSLSYQLIDSDLRRVVLGFSKDSARNDTMYIHRGDTKDWTTTLQGYGKSFLAINLEAGSSSLTVRSYLTVRPETENNTFKDPATGETFTDLIKLLPRFIKPGDDSITLRATHGFQRLLNRARTGATILQDFEFLPSATPAVDTTIDSKGVSTATKVPYPVLSVIPPKLNAGNLQVDIDLYLFPLKAR